VVGLGGGFGELDLVAEGLELTGSRRPGVDAAGGKPTAEVQVALGEDPVPHGVAAVRQEFVGEDVDEVPGTQGVIAVEIVEREREDPEPGVAFLACGNGLPLVVLDAGCNPTGTRRR
jgi:hypothetical protein